MNKYLPIIGIGVIILVAAGAYLVLGKNKSSSPATTTQEEVASEKLSIKDLIAAGGSQQCSFSDENAEGTVYFNDKKMRGDFTTNVETEVESHVIIDGNTMYSWVEGEKNGFKATFNISDEEKEEIANEKIDLSKKVDYKCSAWSVDSSVFTPPADIKFTDFGAFTAPSTTSGNPANCSVCNSLQGDSKMQCLQALKC